MRRPRLARSAGAGVLRDASRRDRGASRRGGLSGVRGARTQGTRGAGSPRLCAARRVSCAPLAACAPAPEHMRSAPRGCAGCSGASAARRSARRLKLAAPKPRACFPSTASSVWYANSSAACTSITSGASCASSDGEVRQASAKEATTKTKPLTVTQLGATQSGMSSTTRVQNGCKYGAMMLRSTALYL